MELSTIAEAAKRVLQGDFKCQAFRRGQLETTLAVLDGAPDGTDTLALLATYSGKASFAAELPACYSRFVAMTQSFGG